MEGAKELLHSHQSMQVDMVVVVSEERADALQVMVVAVVGVQYKVMVTI